MKKPTLTLHECCKVMRSNGFRISPVSLKEGMKKGYYPFGFVKSVGPTGRESVEIYFAQVEKWIRDKTGGVFNDNF